MATTEIMLLSLLIILIIPLILLYIELNKQTRLTDKFSKQSDEQADHIRRLQNDYNSLSDSFKNLAEKYNERKL